ncbi:T9SS type B sorting domain-containing protein [Seonamhaeicola marinus]|uniref:T9SS type B sorting domain-containing protein n=1 Tax=Seonamhaeicola marinus TaxID=1912246 RepID=A0A5D0H3W6_9FLAO|nr:T9SS type B sorting domain-containing protein [Seonamhaeicola marinus]TYA65978.1 T9SS type B sorting domain-containing protein [Seonamhaeicola marinus]
MRKITTLVFFCSLCTLVFSQRQASNWYFGYGAGIEFNLTTNSINTVNTSQLWTNEGCSSISDEYGNLLFYTEGSRVWNRNHTQMGNGFGLFGDNSSTQSAIIVPKPNDPDIYYIFTVDTTVGFDPDNGFNYSVVDMTLDGGLGGVVQKNVNLLPHCSEKLTAVLKDCITKSIWVITLASEDGISNLYNTFYAYEVNDSGVNPTPVKTTFPTLFPSDRRGYLKLSPDGTKLVAAHVRDGMEVYDFDTTTGIVSNPIALTINSSTSPFPYGVEFSPNSQLLYVHASNNYFDPENFQNNEIATNHTSVLSQFNLVAPDIQASQVILDDRTLYRGGLQLGPNGKIYRALSETYNRGLPYLGVINNPNNVGTACNYQHNALSLGGNESSQGLPPFIASFFNQQIDIIKNGRSATNLDLCDGDIYTLTSVDIPGATYTWTRDEILLADTDFDLEVTEAGHYEVYIDPKNGDCAIEGGAFVVYNDNPIANNHTILQCDEDGTPDGFTLFNLNEAIIDINESDNTLTLFYLDAARTQRINASSYTNISNPQTIYVQVLNERTRCSDYSQLTLEVSATDSNNVSMETCDDDGTEDGFHLFNLETLNNEVVNGLPSGLSIAYYETLDDALLEQKKLGNSYTNTTPNYQIIYARVENDNNCYGISEVELTVNPLPKIETEATAIYCLNRFPIPISIDAGIINDDPNNYAYNWSNGQNTYSINVNEAKDYEVEIINTITKCSKIRTVTVIPSNIATIDDIEVIDATQNNMVTVIASGEGEYQYQLLDENGYIRVFFQDSNVFENVFPGFYSVQVRDLKNDCGITNSDKFSVIGFPKFFTPNNDGQNDTWQVYGVSSMFQPNSKIQIFNRYGKLVKEITPLGDGWDGSINGERLPSDDYWFLVKLQDGRVFRSHFTLKN